MSFCFSVFPQSTVLAGYRTRLPRRYRGGRLPRRRNRANAVLSDFCTKQTVVANYRGNLPEQIPFLFLIFVLSKPWRPITAEAQLCICRVIYRTRNRCRGRPC